MKFSLTLAAALFPAVLVNAQSSSSALPANVTSSSSTQPSTVTSPSPSPSSNATQINVQVAPGGQLVYNPPNFAAANGSTVTFNFPSGSTPHSVTQGDFNKPCAYLTASGGDPAGFDSGLLSGKQFSLKITNDKEPIFFFCKTKGHCGLGMVGAINAPAIGNTYAAYLAAAKALGSSAPVISSTGPMTGGVGATAVLRRGVTSDMTTLRSSLSHTSRTFSTFNTPRPSSFRISSTLRPSESGSSTLRPSESGSSTLRPSVSGSSTLRPSVSRSSTLRPSVSGSSTLRPSTSGPSSTSRLSTLTPRSSIIAY